MFLKFLIEVSILKGALAPTMLNIIGADAPKKQ